uniref:Acidic repeat-containing protein n=1 Tax=Cacopsylla melanoneura TaxID=428564 RepID=A0A8D9F3I1_9HEMI
MDDLSFEINAPKNLKSKQTGSRKKFPELSSKVKNNDKENKKPTKSIKLWDPNEDDIRKFLNKKPTKTSSQLTKSKTVDKLKNGNDGVAKKAVADFSSKKKTIDKVENVNTEKSKKTTVNNVKKEAAVASKTMNTKKDAKSKGTAKSTHSKGYDSSNESYKMSTTYEFSGNSRDESGNLSDDSLVKIFKSKLPTSVKIDRMLTPRVNNLRAMSTGTSTRSDKGDSNPSKSKKLTFDDKDKVSAQPKTKPKALQHPNQKRIIQDTGSSAGGFRNSVGFNVFATPLKTTHTKISTPTESETDGHRRNVGKENGNDREKNHRGKKMNDEYFQSDSKGKKIADIYCASSGTEGKKVTSNLTTKKVPLTCKTNENSDDAFDPGLNKKDTKQRVTRTKALRKEKREDFVNENPAKLSQRGTKSTQRNPLTPLSPAQNSSLFSTISGGRNSGSNISGSRNSSLFSSLSPSPQRKGRSSSLFSTMSMESKESHDSSGSVYVSATDSLMSIDDDLSDVRQTVNKEQLDIHSKQVTENRKTLEDRKTSTSRTNVKNKKWIQSENCESKVMISCNMPTNAAPGELKYCMPFSSEGRKTFGDITRAKDKVSARSNPTNNAKDHSGSKDKFSPFSPKMLRSRNNTSEKSSLFSSITSNESLDPTDNNHLRHTGVNRKQWSSLESRNKNNRRNLSNTETREENKSSSLISGIDKLNMTEDKSNLSEDKSNLCKDRSNRTDNVKTNNIRSTSHRRNNSNETRNVERNDNSKPSSIYSSLFSSTSKHADDKPSGDTSQQPGVAEIISISSDSSFDIDADLVELEAAKSTRAAAAGVLCKDSRLSDDSNLNGDSKMSEDSKLSENSKIVEDTKFSEDEIEMDGTRNEIGRSTLAKNSHSASIKGHSGNGNSALHSTFGNMNLTTGVKIRKSKHFFNSSDDRFSSISEPSCCVDSSILQKDNRRIKINETIEARDSDVSNGDGSNEVRAKGLYKVNNGRFHDNYKIGNTGNNYGDANSGNLYPKISETIESTEFKTALGNIDGEIAYKTREIHPNSDGNKIKHHQSHSDNSSWVESSIYPKLDGMKERSNLKTGLSNRNDDGKNGNVNIYPKLGGIIENTNFKTGHFNSNGLNRGAEIDRITIEDKRHPKLPLTVSESTDLTKVKDLRKAKDLTNAKDIIGSKSGGNNVLDDLFDKSKVFNGEQWVSKRETEASFQFKEPKLKDNDTKKNGEHDRGDPRADIDLSSWGNNSRGDVKIKVDRYSLSFNFNKLIGPKPETTSTEQLSSDVKHSSDVNKRKSFNRDLRKSIEIKRSIVISSDSDEDSDDQIRVVSKGKRKQRIFDSSDDEEESVGERSEDAEEVPAGPKGTRKLLHGLTSEFNEILKINKKATAKPVPNTPKAAPPVRSLDKKPKAPTKVTPVPNTPLRTDKISKNNRLTFLSSLSVIVPDSYIPHPEAAVYKTKFKSKKEELTRRLFHLYNKEVFGDRLPSDMPLEWNGRMRTTSGFCYNKRTRSLDPTKPDVRSARIALSKKILDTPDRLRDTLIHELCHAASWLIDGMRDGHGPNWKKWTLYAMQRFPELPPIKRCHDYKIDTKYVYRCSQCDYEFGRHSKSLNVERKVCGYCHGKFILITNTRQGPTEQATKRPPTQFAMFVKENYARVKQDNVGVKHGDVMKLLSQKFAQTKLKDG